MVKIFLLCSVILLAGCAFNEPSSPSADFSNIEINNVGSEQGADICQGFSLSKTAVAQFFTQADEISFQELHDHFDYLPCFVKGSLVNNGKPCAFTIRAGATAELSCKERAQLYYVCKTCDSLFTAD